jgi:ATP-dependent RNA helicase DDX5/DBP2
LTNIDFSKTELVQFEKDFYIEHSDVTKRPIAEADEWRRSKDQTKWRLKERECHSHA